MENDLNLSDCQAQLKDKLSSLTRKRNSLSLFELQIEEDNQKTDEKEYENQLKNELSEWQSLLRKAKSQTNCMANPPQVNGIEINKDILSADQQRYIDDEMPDLQKFIDDSAAFQIKAFNFVHNFDEIEDKEQAVSRLFQDAMEQTIVLRNLEKFFL